MLWTLINTQFSVKDSGLGTISKHTSWNHGWNQSWHSSVKLPGIESRSLSWRHATGRTSLRKGFRRLTTMRIVLCMGWIQNISCLFIHRENWETHREKGEQGRGRHATPILGHKRLKDFEAMSCQRKGKKISQRGVPNCPGLQCHAYSP